MINATARANAGKPPTVPFVPRDVPPATPIQVQSPTQRPAQAASAARRATSTPPIVAVTPSSNTNTVAPPPTTHSSDPEPSLRRVLQDHVTDHDSVDSAFDLVVANAYNDEVDYYLASNLPSLSSHI
jgi:hypothetical protein